MTTRLSSVRPKGSRFLVKTRRAATLAPAAAVPFCGTAAASLTSTRLCCAVRLRANVGSGGETKGNEWFCPAGRRVFGVPLSGVGEHQAGADRRHT